MSALQTPAALVLLAWLSIAQAAEGLITLESPLGARATMDKLEVLAKQRGLNVFARIDHAAGAAVIGTSLRPTELLVFGNPKGGTPFMECAQSAGIDLPLKALVWEDAAGKVWLGYNDPAYLAQRHNVPDCPAVENLRRLLNSLTRDVVAR